MHYIVYRKRHRYSAEPKRKLYLIGYRSYHMKETLVISMGRVMYTETKCVKHSNSKLSSKFENSGTNKANKHYKLYSVKQKKHGQKLLMISIK